MSVSMRIGVFGGTFNPIHFGHLRSAEEVRQSQRLARILFVPSAAPPHKGARALLPAIERLEMVRRAVHGNPYFRVSGVELERTGSSYSVDTISELQRRYRQSRLAFILGFDAFRDIATWKAYQRLFGLCDIIVTSRPPYPDGDLLHHIPVAARGDFCYKRSGTVLQHSSGNRVVFQRISDLDISATRIRQLVRKGHSVRYLVPDVIDRYIRRHGHYTGKGGSN